MAQLRAVVIGAGMAGILAGIKLQEKGITDVTIYEKGDSIGGTWRENTYPGLTCDTPSHHYTYSFERNPDWSSYLPPGPEIKDYFERTAAKYGVDKLIRFNTEIARADYRDGRWHLQLGNGEADVADILIAATGVLHHPSIPNFPGMEDFEGALFHTSRWDHSVPLEGRRVGVVGMGSTGVQIISALAGKAARVEHFVRNPQWIMPVENAPYDESQRETFRQDPAALAEEMDMENYLANVQAYTQCLIDSESETARAWQAACLENLEQGVTDPALREQLRPDHVAFCKRLIFSPDYYQKIQHPQAKLVRSDIERFEKHGIRTRDGELHELDVIALATGFKADQFMRPMEITGQDGLDLETYWAERPQAYLAITMPGFPNLFMLNGPNGPVGNFSLVEIAEYQWGYIDQLIQKLLDGECREISPTVEASEQFNAERIEAAKKTVWYTGGCKSWYLDKQGIPSSWPWDYDRFRACMAAPKEADFHFA